VVGVGQPNTVRAINVVEPMTIAAARAIGLLEQVVAGHVGADLALRAWPTADPDGAALLADAWCDLSDFAADEDLRAIAPDYADYQRRLLERRVTELKARVTRAGAADTADTGPTPIGGPA
jgi:hypothetical protein